MLRNLTLIAVATLTGGASLLAQAVPQQEQPIFTDQPAAKPKSKPAKEIYSGPIKIEPGAIFDSRVKNFGTGVGDRKPSFQLVLKIVGGRLGEVVRLGQPIVDELVDDTGTPLIDPDKYSNRLRTLTKRYQIPPASLKNGFLPMRLNPKAPPRSATKIARCRGYVNMVLSGEATLIAIEDPWQYQGSYIRDDRLDELGIQIEFLTDEQAPETADDPAAFALRLEGGVDHIRNIIVYDDWMRATNTRFKEVRGPDKRPYNVYKMIIGQFSQDCELGVWVYADIELKRIEFDLSDLPLP